MLRIIGSLLFLGSLLWGQELGKGLLLTKGVFEERMVWDKFKGNVSTVRPATEAKKNATLVYVNQLTNRSPQTQKNIVIDNPIPYGTMYVPNTARCEASCKLYFSIDGGKSFKRQEALFVVYGTKQRPPLGSEYTHIKFVFPQLLSKQKVRMAFKSRIK